MSNIIPYHHGSRAGRALQARSNIPPLPGNDQDHLGQLLRAEYYERADKARYLGDPALPLAFDPYLRRLEMNDMAFRMRWIRATGTKAIADALQSLNA